MRLATKSFGVAIITLAAWGTSGTIAEAQQGVPLAKVLGIDLDADADVDVIIGPVDPLADDNAGNGAGGQGGAAALGAGAAGGGGRGGCRPPAFDHCAKPVNLCCRPVVACKPNPCINDNGGRGYAGCDPGRGINIVININIEITIIINVNASPAAFGV